MRWLVCRPFTWAKDQISGIVDDVVDWISDLPGKAWDAAKEIGSALTAILLPSS